MKVAIVGDTHVGMRKDSLKFHKHASKFFSMLFDYLDKHNIKTILQLGDLFDSRKSINPYSVAESKKYFFNKFLHDTGIEMITLLGNHDIYWRESLSVNSPTEVLGPEFNINIVDKPTTLKIGNIHCDFIPWMCDENYEECIDFMKKSSSDYCFGHFEIAGAKMYKGAESHSGLSAEIFRDYKRVFSGHFHTQTLFENIQYVGTPYEITWEDYNDPRGFHILDTETGTIEFIENPHTMFTIVEYSNGFLGDYSTLNEKIVKVLVRDKANLYDFEHFINKINSSGAYDVKIVENLNTENGEIDETINLADTVSILNSYIDSIDISHKKEVKHYLKMLHTEALNIEVV